jgi:hypothetical protein
MNTPKLYNTGNSATAAMSMKQQKSCSKSLLLASSDEEERFMSNYRSVTSTSDGDVDVMIRHPDFPELVGIAVKMEGLYGMILKSTGQPWTSQQSLPRSSLTVEEIFQSTLNLQDELKANARPTVRRGEYPVTDALMDDSLKLLRREWDDMICFHFALPSMKAGLVNQNKGRAYEARQKEQNCVNTKKTPFKTETGKRKRSPQKSGIPSKRPSKWNFSEPEVIVIDDEPELTPELPVLPVKHQRLSPSAVASMMKGYINRTDSTPELPVLPVKHQRLSPSAVASMMKGYLNKTAELPVLPVKHQRLSPSAVAFMMKGYLNTTDSSSDMVSTSPLMFDESGDGKCDEDDGLELMDEFSEKWLASNDLHSFVCAPSLDDFILDAQGDESGDGKCDNDDGFELMIEIEFSEKWLASNDLDTFVCAPSIDDFILDAQGEEESFDDVDLGDETMENWADQFGLSLE